MRTFLDGELGPNMCSFKQITHWKRSGEIKPLPKSPCLSSSCVSLICSACVEKSCSHNKVFVLHYKYFDQYCLLVVRVIAFP